MDLRYDVIINTKNAKIATEELEQYFEDLGKSSDKSIKKLGRYGSEFVQELKQGKMTSEDARKSIEALQRELRRLNNEGRKGSEQDKVAMKQINAELVNMNRQVKRVERSRTEAHRKNLQQMKAEEREQQKQIANERRLERQNRRSAIVRTRYAGAQLTKAGMGEIGGMVGSVSGILKFGAIGAAISGITAIFKRYKESFEGLFKFIQGMLDNLFYYIDTLMSKLGINKGNPTEKYVETKVNREREEYEKAKENVDKTKSASSTTELLTAIRELRKVIPTLAGLTDKQIMDMKKSDLMSKLDSEFDLRYRSVISSYDVRGKMFAENYARIERYQQEIRDINKLFDLANQEGSKVVTQYIDENGNEIDVREQWQNEIHELQDKIREERDAIVKGTDAEYEKIKAQNALIKSIEARKKAEDAAKKRLQDLETIKGISKGVIPDMPDYDTALYTAQEKYKANISQLDKLKPTATDSQEYRTEWDKAKERAENELQQAQKVANDAVKDLVDNIETQLNGTIESEYKNTLRTIEEGCKALNDQIDKMLGNTERAEELKGKVGRIEAIKKENAQVEETIRLLKEESDERMTLIELNEEELDDYEVERRALQEKINLVYDEIDAIERQVDISEDERNTLRKLREEARRYEKQLERNTKANEEFAYSQKMANLSTVANAFGSSGNQYGQAIGQAFGGIINGLDMANQRRNGTMTKQQATASAVAAGVEFGLQQFDLIFNYIKNNKAALEQWNNALEDSAHKLAMLKLEEFEYRQKNIFGVENPYDRMTAALNKERAVREETANLMQKLANGQVQTGMKNKYDAGEMATIIGSGIMAGAGIGASVGSAGSWVGTIIGAVAGAITGTVTGLIAAKDKVAVYDSLKNKYGYVFDTNTLDINKKILADYDLMDEKTKKLVDNAKELLEIQKQTREELNNYIIELVGQLGSESEAIMLEAFKNDRIFEAIDDIKSYVGDTMESIISKEIFGNVFGQSFKKLQDRLTNGILKVDEYGVAHIVGDIPTEMTQLANMMNDNLLTYKLLMEQVQDKFKDWGYDILGNDEGSQEQLKGAISGMTEETASRINGNFFGLKLTAMEVSDKMSAVKTMVGEVTGIAHSSLGVLREIAENTLACKRIEGIANDIAYIKANGVNVR